MKKVVVIAVLFVVLVNTMGYFFIFKCNQYHIKKGMLSEISIGIFQPDIVILKILHPEKERQFLRIENNEFTYCGRLYDIVVERKSGDTTLFYCLHDKKEETLVSDFSLYLRFNGRSGSSSKDNPIHALLYNLITQALIQNATLPLHGEGITWQFPEIQSTIIPVYLVHSAPPPKTA